MADNPNPAPETPDPATVETDIAKIKSMLNLPETATDVELIAALVQLVAGLQAKYDALLGDAVQLEDKLANRDVEDFADVITNDTREFWKNQFLQNRDQTTAVLIEMRGRTPADPPPPAPALAPSQPLKNRLVALVKPVTALAEEPAQAEKSLAAKIRNRAQHIATTEKIPFRTAFSRAEKEILEPK
jgi:hypothetical protein